jgi:hypothetical protein
MCSCASSGLPAARQRQIELLAVGAEPGLGQRAQGVGLQADAARGAADQLDDAFAGQRLQVFFRRVGRLEAEFGGDLGTGGWRAGAFDRALHQVEHLLLAGGEFRAVVHGGGLLVGLLGRRGKDRCRADELALRLAIHPVTVFSSMILKVATEVVPAAGRELRDVGTRAGTGIAGARCQRGPGR